MIFSEKSEHTQLTLVLGYGLFMFRKLDSFLYNYLNFKWVISTLLVISICSVKKHPPVA